MILWDKKVVDVDQTTSDKDGLYQVFFNFLVNFFFFVIMLHDPFAASHLPRP